MINEEKIKEGIELLGSISSHFKISISDYSLIRLNVENNNIFTMDENNFLKEVEMFRRYFEKLKDFNLVTLDKLIQQEPSPISNKFQIIGSELLRPSQNWITIIFIDLIEFKVISIVKSISDYSNLNRKICLDILLND